MKKFLSCAIALLLTIVVAIGFAATTVSAAVGDTITVTRRLAYRNGQQAGEGNVHGPGSASTHYNNRVYWFDRREIDVLTIQGGTYNGRIAYCIHHGASFGPALDADRTTFDRTVVSFDRSDYWNSLTPDQQDLLSRLMPHIYPAQSYKALGVNSVDDAFAASQVVVWEVVHGYRDATGKLLNSTLRDQYLKYTYTGYGHTAGEDTPAMIAYNKIDEALRTHSTHTSWDKQTIELTWSNTNKRYEAQITDTNGVLDQFEIPATINNGTIHLEADENNTLTIWSTDAFDGTVSHRFYKDLPTKEEVGALAAIEKWGPEEYQQMVIAGCVDDPVYSDLKITTDSGTLQIIKKTTVPNGTVAGIVFSVYSPSWNGGVPKEFTTDASGRITANIPAGKYVVEEVSEFAGVRKPAPQTVTVKAGSTPASVTFTNTPEDEEFTVRKIDLTWGQVANIPFRIGHTGGTSASQNWYYPCTTNASGEFKVYNYDVTDYYWRKNYKYYNLMDEGVYATEAQRLNACAEEIYAECFGTSTTNKTARLNVIKAALTYVGDNLNNLLTVVADTYEVTELGWKMSADMNPENYLVYYRTNQEWTKTVSINPASTGNIVTFDNGAQHGSLLIVKTSEDGVVNGIPFLIEELDADDNVLYSYQYTTKRTTVNGVATDGVIYWSNANCVPGRYRITELGCAENGYEEQAPQIVTVKADETAKVAFKNWVTRTPVSAYKTSDSGDVAGFNFAVTGTVEPTLAAQMKSVDPSFSATVNITGLVSNANGEIVYASTGKVVELLPGTYTWNEKLTTAQAKIYVQPDPVTITINRGDPSAEVHFHNKYNPVPTNIYKVINQSGLPLDKFTFSIVGETTTGIPVDMQDLVTNTSGLLIDPITGKAPELWPGEYTLTEYLTDEQKQTYNVMDAKTFTITAGAASKYVYFTNSSTNVTLKKTSDTGIVEGFTFRFVGTTESGVAIDVSGTTDAAGEIHLFLPNGTYTVSEVLTEEQKLIYDQPEPQPLTIQNSPSSVTISFHNASSPEVELVKTSSDGNVDGFEFYITTSTDPGTVLIGNLFSHDGGKIELLNADGTYSPVNLPVGTYYLYEKLTEEQKQNYMTQNPQYFSVTAGDETVKVEFENLPKEVTVEIYKYTDDMENLGGFHFILEGTEKVTGDAVYIDDLVSDKYGVVRRADATIPKLKIGTYTIREVMTEEQAKTYKQPDPQTFTLTESHVEAGYMIPFTNSYQPGQITITKKNRSNEVLAGAEYLLEYSTDGGATWNVATSQQCTSAGLANGILVTDTDGLAVFEGLKADGTVKYRVTEVKAPEGYSLISQPVFEDYLPGGESGTERQVSLTVTNELEIEIPMTGVGDGISWFVIFMAALSALMLGMTFWVGLKRPQEDK